MKKADTTYWRIASLSLLYIFLISCSSKKQDPAPSFNGRKYTIAEGSHESDHPTDFPSLATDLNFKAKFDSSAIYTTTIPSNQDDTNKLLGYSDCGSFHDTNSARFGWRWVDGQLQIMAYWYVNGVRPEPIQVANVSINTINSYRIQFQSDKYIFTVNDTNKVEVPKTCHYNGIRYKLYPYFGGDENAPHEIRIWIEE
jgi:hypothetical protein